MARGQPVAGLVEEFADQRCTFGRIRVAAAARRIGNKPLLQRVPGGRIKDGRMLARIDLVAVPDASGIERVGQDLVDMASAEGRPAAGGARGGLPFPYPCLIAKVPGLLRDRPDRAKLVIGGMDMANARGRYTRAD
jgi:hypothetical protein